MNRITKYHNILDIKKAMDYSLESKHTQKILKIRYFYVELGGKTDENDPQYLLAYTELSVSWSRY